MHLDLLLRHKTEWIKIVLALIKPTTTYGIWYISWNSASERSFLHSPLDSFSFCHSTFCVMNKFFSVFINVIVVKIVRCGFSLIVTHIRLCGPWTHSVSFYFGFRLTHLLQFSTSCIVVNVRSTHFFCHWSHVMNKEESFNHRLNANKLTVGFLCMCVSYVNI